MASPDAEKTTEAPQTGLLKLDQNGQFANPLIRGGLRFGLCTFFSTPLAASVVAATEALKLHPHLTNLEFATQTLSIAPVLGLAVTAFAALQELSHPNYQLDKTDHSAPLNPTNQRLRRGAFGAVIGLASYQGLAVAITAVKDGVDGIASTFGSPPNLEALTQTLININSPESSSVRDLIVRITFPVMYALVGAAIGMSSKANTEPSTTPPEQSPIV